MARYTFFSFDYEDVKNFKVNVVRNSWLLGQSSETFVDGSIWEKEKSKGKAVIRELIDNGLGRTSVTTVLIGEETANRHWVKYEIVKSFDKGNGLLGIHINRIRGKDQTISARGANPFDKLKLYVSEDGKKIEFSELINRSWVPYAELPIINNKKSNSIHFADGMFSNKFGQSFKFSELFDTYCWDFDNGHTNFAKWVEQAAKEVGR